MSKIRLLYPILLLIALIAAIHGCTGLEPSPADSEKNPVVRLPEKATLLPILDSRSYQSIEEPPDLKTTGAPVIYPANQLLQTGREQWERDGLADDLAPYNGPIPNQTAFSWNSFPVRGMTTDLGLGLEVTDFSLFKTGQNTWMAPHAIFDAAILPVFFAGVVATDGHMDLGGRIFPSSMIELIIQVDLNVISLKGGGPVLSKSYVTRLPTEGVTEGELHAGLAPNARDGMDAGLKHASSAINRVFDMIARDPELELLPDIADIAWLDRVLKEQYVSADAKAGILAVFEKKHLPPQTKEDAPENAPLGESTADSPELRLSRAENRLSLSLFEVVLSAAGRLEAQDRTYPVRQSNMRLNTAVSAFLANWAAIDSGAGMLMSAVGNSNRPTEERLAAWRVLVGVKGNPEVEQFVERELTAWTTPADEASDSAETAAFVLAARGEEALEELPVSRRVWMGALTGRDAWAAPYVMRSLVNENFNPELIRLAGLLKIEAAKPILTNALMGFVFPIERSYKLLPKPVIPILPSPPSSQGGRYGIDPVGLIRSLACFRGDADVMATMRAIMDEWDTELSVSDEIAAEAVLALGRLGEPDRARFMAGLWKKLALSGESVRVRRAALEAMILAGDTSRFDVILETARKLFLDESYAAPLEAADAFGRLRYSPAADFLAETASSPNSPPSLRKTALAGLSRLADQDSASKLKAMVRSTGGAPAEEARKALDEWTMENAMLKELARWSRGGQG